MFAQKITAILCCAKPFVQSFRAFVQCFKALVQSFNGFAQCTNGFAQNFNGFTQCFKAFAQCFITFAQCTKPFVQRIFQILFSFFVQNFHVNICLAEFRVFKTDCRVFNGVIFAAVFFGIINGQNNIFRDKDAVIARLIFKNS